MDKKAQEGAQSTVDVQKQELQTTITNYLTQFDKVMKDSQKKMNDQLTMQLNNIIQNLNRDVNSLIENVKTQTVPVPSADDGLEANAYFQGGGGVNEPTPKKRKYKENTPKHPAPRGDGESTPMFWKPNFDYGEGPYQNLDKMKGKKITEYEDTLIPDGRYKKPKKRRKK